MTRPKLPAKDSNKRLITGVRRRNIDEILQHVAVRPLLFGMVNVMVKRADGSLELEIMQILWSRQSPMSPNEVREHLSGNLAYTSVATVLTRLCEKNQVKRSIAGRNYVYVASILREDWYSNRMSAILNETKNHRELLAGFVGKLSKRDRKDLQRILGEEK